MHVYGPPFQLRDQSQGPAWKSVGKIRNAKKVKLEITIPVIVFGPSDPPLFSISTALLRN